MAQLELNGITKRYAEIYAARDVTLTVADGEFVALLGPSGCGKTTTMRMIAGFAEPTSGSVHLGGRDITRLPPWKRDTGLVFQSYALFPHLTVAQNVAFGLEMRKMRPAEIAPRVEEALQLVRLGAHGSRLPRQLSGGQQQRVALARALVLNPRVLLLDEPLGALDLKLRRQMQLLLKSLQRELEITFVYVTHDQEEAFSMSDRVGVMNAGRLEQVGAPYDVYQRPRSFFVADFVGAANCLVGTIAEVTDASTYTVALTHSAVLVKAGGVPGLGVGDHVAALARPEAARIGDPSPCCLEARGNVKNVAYAGPQIAYTVASNGLGDLTVFAKTDTRSGLLTLGEGVNLSWDASDLWILPMHEEAGEDVHSNGRGSPSVAH
jgi:ABC-type Fe3+/spermidine/putrescine transport system ATPase subunit